MGKRRGEGNLLEGSVSLSNAREDDMISKLPDSLISHMLLYLPTKLAVRTSVLSNRWKRLWLLIPGLDLDSSEFPDYNAFVTFMEKFLNFSREQKSCLHKLKLSIQKDENGQSFLTRWIDFAATPKLQQLDVQYLLVKPECFELIPVSILTCCKTLLYLRLHRVSLGSFESVSLPCVKTMRLEYNVYANEASLELLISSCPVLEDLGIVRRRVGDNVRVLRVHSNTITSLSIETGESDDDDGDDEYDYGINSEVIIDAPRLKYLDFHYELSASKTISNSGSLASVNILDDFYVKDTVVRKFLTSISGVRSMKIDWSPFVFLQNAMPLPQFCNLSCLEVELYFCSVDVLPKLLESFPNLRSLVMDLIFSSVKEQPRLSFVPQCLLSSLKFVEIKSESTFDGASKMEIKLAKYFAENSVILKKLVLNVKSLMPEEKTVVVRCLTAKLRRDSTCQIIVS